MSKSSAIELVRILTLFHATTTTKRTKIHLSRAGSWTEIYYARAIMKPIYQASTRRR